MPYQIVCLSYYLLHKQNYFERILEQSEYLAQIAYLVYQDLEDIVFFYQ